MSSPAWGQPILAVFGVQPGLDALESGSIRHPAGRIAAPISNRARSGIGTVYFMQLTGSHLPTYLSTHATWRCMISSRNFGSRGPCGVRGYTTIFAVTPCRFKAL